MYWRMCLVGMSMLCGLTGSLRAEEQQSFASYIDELRLVAISSGKPKDIIEDNFPKVKLFKRAFVTQPQKNELQQTLESYLPQLLTDDEILLAQTFYNEHEQNLQRIGQQYGVQPRFIVALWGVVSNFGVNVGSYPVMSVTASLAFQNTEKAHNQREFLAAIDCIDRHNAFNDLLSDRHGAMGQLGFTPSRYLDYAQDGNNDGKKNIWSDTNDIFASIAYFLQQAGWKESETWGRQIKLPADFDVNQTGVERTKTFSEWQALGVRRYNGADLPNRDDMAVSVILPDGIKGRQYAVYDNYRALLKWNNSDYFAISVTYLSERIKMGG